MLYHRVTDSQWFEMPFNHQELLNQRHSMYSEDLNLQQHCYVTLIN